ncbi:MAG: peptide chain release factor 2, partial [Deltaproteobacteria bacterium]|nr:peptide chain release factor 2 [Deltaproteobacteria bacterium]
MLVDLKPKVKQLSERLSVLRGYFDLEGINLRLNELNGEMAKLDFWDNPQNAQAVGQEQMRLAEKLNAWQKLEDQGEELFLLMDMALDENDEAQFKDIEDKIGELTEKLDFYEVRRTLSGPNDANNAIMDIHAGAGGTDAQDWAQMLLRMYLRYADRHKFSVQILDRLDGDEAGLKSVTLTISGPYAYGLLSTEVGIHRLVRISAFDSQSRRHTSFASVFVTPEVNDDIVIDINEKDLRIDTYRASGSGGQHVNKTSSAVRITHLPTGIVVQCQDEKSQHRNKDLGMKVLRARLYQLEEEKKAAEIKKIHDNKKDIAWGSQIRSYTLQPYRLIKDHRTGYESGNVEAVLDGDLAGFIKAYLLLRSNENSSDRKSTR